MKPVYIELLDVKYNAEYISSIEAEDCKCQP